MKILGTKCSGTKYFGSLVSNILSSENFGPCNFGPQSFVNIFSVINSTNLREKIKEHLYTNTNKEKSRPFFSKMPLAFRLITQDPLHA